MEPGPRTAQLARQTVSPHLPRGLCAALARRSGPHQDQRASAVHNPALFIRGMWGSPFNRRSYKILGQLTATTTASCGPCSSAPLMWRPLSRVYVAAEQEPADEDAKSAAAETPLVEAHRIFGRAPSAEAKPMRVTTRNEVTAMVNGTALTWLISSPCRLPARRPGSPWSSAAHSRSSTAGRSWAPR